jgi:hypothetical protein
LRTVEEQVKEIIELLKKGYTLCYGYATEELANKGGHKGLSCYRNNIAFCFQNEAKVFKQVQAQTILRKLRTKKELAPFKVELYKLETKAKAPPVIGKLTAHGEDKK